MQKSYEVTPRQKIELRRSEFRSRLGEIAGLSGDALSDEITAERDGLMTELTASEAQLRAAIGADGAETRAAPANDDDAEGAELRALTARSSAGAIFAAAIEHRATDGATAELQQHYRLSPNQVPLAMLRSIETRAVTPAPAAVGQNQAAIIPGVFPRAVAAFLGVDMPMVPVGEAVYPVLTTNAAAGVPNEGSPLGAATDATAQASFAVYRGLVYDAAVLDGLYAQQAMDVRVVVGAATYAHAGAQYRSNNADDSAIDSLMRISGGVRISPHVPAPDTNDQLVVISKAPMMRNAVAPLWEEVTIIPDEITKAASGEIVLTAVMLRAVKILRAAAFARKEVQLAA